MRGKTESQPADEHVRFASVADGKNTDFIRYLALVLSLLGTREIPDVAMDFVYLGAGLIVGILIARPAFRGRVRIASLDRYRHDVEAIKASGMSTGSGLQCEAASW